MPWQQPPPSSAIIPLLPRRAPLYAMAAFIPSCSCTSTDNFADELPHTSLHKILEELPQVEAAWGKMATCGRRQKVFALHSRRISKFQCRANHKHQDFPWEAKLNTTQHEE